MNFFRKFQIVFLSYVLFFVTTIQNTRADVIAPLGQPVPQGPVQVTPEEFNELKKHQYNSKPKESVKAEVPIHNEEPVPTLIKATASLAQGSGQAAIFIFAVMGTVLVVAWIPYVVYLSYQKLKYPDQFKLHQIISTQVTYIEDTKRINQKRKGVMSSLRYTPLISQIRKDGKKTSTSAYYGFNFELGHFDFYDQNRTTFEKQDYHSMYWLVGPSYVFGDLENDDLSLFLKIDLTAGTSFRQDVDLILKGELSVNMLFDNMFFIGVGGTLLYLYGREGKGIVTNVNKTSFQAFGNFGIVF